MNKDKLRELQKLDVGVEFLEVIRGILDALLEDAPEVGEPKEEPRLEKICRRLIMFAFYIKPFHKEVMEHIHLFPENYRNLLEKPDPQTKKLITKKAEKEFYGVLHTKLSAELESLLRELKLENLRKKKMTLRELIRELDGGGISEDEGESMRLLEKFYEVSKEMDSIRNQADLKK